MADTHPGLAPAQGWGVAVVDAAQVGAKGTQLTHGASGFVTGTVPWAQWLQREGDTYY